MTRMLRVMPILGALVLLTACEDFVRGNWGNSERFKDDFHYSYPLKAGGSLSVENFNGSIEILGWDQDKAVANLLAIFRHEFSGFWGPRMEDAFRFALLTLYAANQSLCKQPGGRERQEGTQIWPALAPSLRAWNATQERRPKPPPTAPARAKALASADRSARW